jgi:hypothetical protein
MMLEIPGGGLCSALPVPVKGAGARNQIVRTRLQAQFRNEAHSTRRHIDVEGGVGE